MNTGVADYGIGNGIPPLGCCPAQNMRVNYGGLGMSTELEANLQNCIFESLSILIVNSRPVPLGGPFAFFWATFHAPVSGSRTWQSWTQ